MNIIIKILIALISYLGLSLAAILITNTNPEQTTYDTIVVLGNSPNENEIPNTFLQARLDKAIELYKIAYAKRIILTGGKKESSISEAEIMHAYCIKKGLPNTALIIEDKAKSTLDNLIFSAKIMRESDMSSMLIVTSNHHMFRTRKICEFLDLENYEIVSARNNLLTIVSFFPLRIIEQVKLSRLDKEV